MNEETTTIPVLDATVGTPCILEPKGVGHRIKTRFVGWEQGKYLAFKLPRILNITDHLYPEKPVIVRYLNCKGRLVGFESLLQGVTRLPQRLIFLDYPLEMEYLSLRHEDRVDCFLPARLEVADQTLTGNILNISKSGCRFLARLEPEASMPELVLETEVALTFTLLHETVSEFTVSGLVKKLGKGGQEIGIEFQDPAQDFQDKMEQYVAEVSEHLGGHCTFEE